VKWRPDSFRSRIMAIAMLPAIVLAIGLGSYMVIQHHGALEQDLKQRGHLMARQLAAASDYGVFAGNSNALQNLVDSIISESSVAGVVVADRQGKVLASKGTPIELPASNLELVASAREIDRGTSVTEGEWVFVEPVRSPALLVDDISDARPFADVGANNRGYTGIVAVLLTTTAISLEKRQFAFAVGSILVVVLFGAGLIARRMSSRVSEPIIDVARAVERIGRGEPGVRVRPSAIGVLHRLGSGVNQMAFRLEHSMQDLESRVAIATRELSTRRDEAERANQAKTRFLAAASHDLRQPIHALGMFVAALSEPRSEAERTQLIEQVNRAVSALGTLLDSLLDISRLDAGRIEVNKAPLALQELFDHLRFTFAEAAESKGLELIVRRTSYWVMSDGVLLERILTNLVANAIAYTRFGRVVVAARRQGEHARVEVRDSGIGIPKDAHDRIFDEFVQLDNPERDRSKGIGLGLAIVRRLATLLDNSIRVRSCPDVGSVFSIEVPRTSAQAGPIAVAHAGVDSVTQMNMCVLVIDDDPMVRDSIAGLLRDWGCDVYLEPGDAYLPSRLVDWPVLPDVILCDLRLAGGLSGTELIASIHAAAGMRIPAIIVTGDTDPQTVREASRTGNIVLRKPVRPAQLRALLRTQVRTRGAPTSHQS